LTAREEARAIVRRSLPDRPEAHVLDRIAVFVYADDPISEAGLRAQLRARPGMDVVDAAQVDHANVAVVVLSSLDDPGLRVVRAIERNGCPRVVLVSDALDETAVVAAVEAGANTFLRRQDASPDRIEAAIRAATSGDGMVPPDVLGRLLDQIGQMSRNVLAPRGLTFSGLTDREVDVLRLVAEGYDTSEIARTLSYSERTIKNVLHDMTSRLNLKNRSHAVAYAVRAGLI
jgi:DNA-binding NarL/FixJ family response regulator